MNFAMAPFARLPSGWMLVGRLMVAIPMSWNFLLSREPPETPTMAG